MFIQWQNLNKFYNYFNKNKNLNLFAKVILDNTIYNCLQQNIYINKYNYKSLIIFNRINLKI